MSRGNGRMQIFLDDRDHREFIYLLGAVCEEFEIECWSHCEMPNHYHAVLRAMQENFSQAIQVLNGEYAKWWNRRHSRVGHVFQGRFKDQIVGTPDYVRTLLRYVARNPVRARLVDDPAKWPWSSYAATVGLEPALSFLTLGPALAHFGEGGTESARQSFADFVAVAAEGSLEDRIRSKDRVLGDAAFKRAFKAMERELRPVAAVVVAEDARTPLVSADLA